MGHQEVGHGEQGRVHDAGRPREDDDAQFAARRCHADHSHRVHQLTAHIHRFGPAIPTQTHSASIHLSTIHPGGTAAAAAALYRAVDANPASQLRQWRLRLDGQSEASFKYSDSGLGTPTAD